MSWTAFDRYARYGAIARAIVANLGDGPHRALDVGDNSGYLQAFAPALSVVSVDVEVNLQPLPDTRLALADGSRLPIANRGVDVVVSCDALEHVPPAHRLDFVRELSRCTRDLVVVAAPFDTPGVAGSEELVRRFIGGATGSPQPQLAEHAAHGLPSLGATQEAMEATGLTTIVIGNGNLTDWVLGMMIKHQVVGSGRFLDLDMGFDIFYNLALQERSQVGPFYRHLLIGRRDAKPASGLPAPSGVPTLDAEPLLTALLASVPGSTGSMRAVEGLEAQQSEAFTHLMARLEGVEAALSHLMERFDGTDAALEMLRVRTEPAAPGRSVRHRLARLRRRRE